MAAVVVPVAVALAVGTEPGPPQCRRRRSGPGRRHRCHRVVGVTGSRPALAALVAAASFDFFLTRPYGSFRISRQADITTEILFVVVGLIVGELAARGRATSKRPPADGWISPASTTSVSGLPAARTRTSC